MNFLRLTTVHLGERLEEIGKGAFQEVDPPAVKAKNEFAFMNCLQLTTVNHGEELEEIGKRAFQEQCTCHPTVKVIKDCAFFW